MDLESFEEKIIYNKLMTGKINNAKNQKNNISQSQPKEVPKPICNEYEKNTKTFNDCNNIETLRHLMDKVNNYLNVLENTRENTSYRFLNSKNRIIRFFIVFVKRIIRKLIFWYIEPICQQQTEFNNAVTPSIGYLNEINIGVTADITKLMNDISILSYELDKIKHLQESMNDKLMHGDLAAVLKLADENYIKKHDETQALLQISNDQTIKKQQTLEMIFMKQKEENEKKAMEYEKVQQFMINRINEIQEKIDKLNQLELNIFDEKPKTIFDLGSYAQSGEDMIMFFILQELGFKPEEMSYIDLGANHAKFLSNTFCLYRYGVRGVLVEANPNLIPELKFYRNGDIILNKCVAEFSGDKVDFYIMSGDGLSTINKSNAVETVNKNSSLKIENIVQVETITVNDVIENYLGKTPTILNIDIEGDELKILRTINFKKYRPLIIIIEMIPYTMPFVIVNKSQEILEYMADIEYQEYAFTGINSIFIDKRQLIERGRLRI